MLAGIRWSLTSFSQKENVSCEQVILFQCSIGFLAPFWIIWQLLESRYYICLNQTATLMFLCAANHREVEPVSEQCQRHPPLPLLNFGCVALPIHPPNHCICRIWYKFCEYRKGIGENKSTLNWLSAFCPDSQKCKLQSLPWGLAQFSLCRRWSQKTKLLKMESRKGQVLVLSLHLYHIRKETQAHNSSVCNKLSSLLPSLRLAFHLDLNFPSKVSHPAFLKCME